MIVCICNNVSDHKIRQAVQLGANSMADLRRDLDVATQCGKCHSCAKQVLKQCMQDAPLASVAARMIPIMPVVVSQRA